MTSAAQQIVEQALNPAGEERSDIIVELLNSIQDQPLEGYEKTWLDEIRSRLQDIDSGRAIMTSAAESVRIARARAGLS